MTAEVPVRQIMHQGGEKLLQTEQQIENNRTWKGHLYTMGNGVALSSVLSHVQRLLRVKCGIS